MAGTKGKILVVEDDEGLVEEISLHLEHLGYEVYKACSGIEGIRMAKDILPDIVILDVMLPQKDGIEVCDELKRNVETKNIPIIMLTASVRIEDEKKGMEKGVEFYIAKPYNRDRLEVYIKTIFSRKKPYELPKNECFLSLNCISNQRIQIRLKGDIKKTDRSDGNLLISPSEYANRADDVYQNKSRPNIKITGGDLYRKIFSDHEEVLSTYKMAIGRVDDPNLHIRFRVDRGMLRLPFEFLCDDKEYLVLRHPFARMISGIETRRQPLSPKFFNSLWEAKESLKILLIASNTRPSIPGVDKEFESLKSVLKKMFEEKGLDVNLKPIPTSEATYETIKKELKNCKYHIVHYAGHGKFEAEESSIYFWEKENMKGDPEQMKVSELKSILRSSDVRFFYLSCCFGTATADLSKLYYNDFLGLADGLIQAGIPSILGFRWPVSDKGAKNFSIEFYRSLSEHGQIDKAVMEARCYVAKDRNDFTWISPILTLQD